MMQKNRPMTEPMPAAALDPVVALRPVATSERPVRLIAGADVQDLPLAGRLVGEARTVARNMFAVAAAAVAIVDGERVEDDHVLAAGQTLEFVKYAGQKGAAWTALTIGHDNIVELVNDRAVWRRAGRQMAATSVRSLFDQVLEGGRDRQNWKLVPPGVRLLIERGSTAAIVIEMPPAPRAVRWITDDSPADCGPEAKMREYRLAFPWTVLIVVLAEGELTQVQQAFYRTTPLATLDDELYFTNLLNVARGYDLESWVCLVNLMSRLGRLDWGRRVRAITEHFWHAAFTRSSEVHEGNSWWSAGAVDERLRNPDTWAAATEADPYFVLAVPWRKAPQRLGETVSRMLDRVAPWRPVESVEQVVTLLQRED
jgi:hypothetical protein